MHLAVSDYGGLAIYLLNPSHSSSVTRLAMPYLLAPAGLVIPNSGTVYDAGVDTGGTGIFNLYKQTAGTRAIQIGTFQAGGRIDEFDRLFLSADGSRIVGAMEGETFWIDTSNDQPHYSVCTGNNVGGTPELALSADQSTVLIDSFIADFEQSRPRDRNRNVSLAYHHLAAVEKCAGCRRCDVPE